MTNLNPVRRRTVQEIGRASSASFTVVAGALTQVFDINPINYPFFTLGVRTNAAHPFDMVAQFRTGGTGLPLGGVAPTYNLTAKVNEADLRKLTDWEAVLMDRVTIYIRNNDTVDHTYDALMYGVG